MRRGDSHLSVDQLLEIPDDRIDDVSQADRMDWLPDRCTDEVGFDGDRRPIRERDTDVCPVGPGESEGSRQHQHENRCLAHDVLRLSAPRGGVAACGQQTQTAGGSTRWRSLAQDVGRLQCRQSRCCGSWHTQQVDTPTRLYLLYPEIAPSRGATPPRTDVMRPPGA